FKTARTTLIDLAAKQLPINTISPYQGKGGIIKSSHFFGRQVILDKLEQQYNSNFLLVGGRQLGKTSLLKALYRKLNNQTNNHCLYLSLSDERLLPRLAYQAKISAYKNLDDLTQQIKRTYPQKKIRLLIDESDLFIQAEINTGYELLNQVRRVAENGTCQFIFAGFWELYANAVLDYHSPLRNLAHSITVGPLEAQPATQLIQQPMSMLRQKFASQHIIEDIYQKTGGRANLINLVCEYLVEQLTDHRQVIDTALVEQAYQSDQVQDALQGWSNLTSETKASALDRIIVYLMFMQQSIDLKMINLILQQHTLSYNPEQLKQSLQRLRLAHIIYKNKEKYQFAVPLFTQQHDAKEAKVLLQQEIQFLTS
ncbi:MAG: AAA family ATPase, partial [Xanthomonadales bacterium]|nr:AAA family ATPase [Xanthomonadales bacterium]